MYYKILDVVEMVGKLFFSNGSYLLPESVLNLKIKVQNFLIIWKNIGFAVSWTIYNILPEGVQNFKINVHNFLTNEKTLGLLFLERIITFNKMVSKILK